jgi:hypothetical protein
MDSDTFTEVTGRSWFGRIGSSIKGVLFGLVLGGLATALLWWNEGRAVTTAKSLKEGAAAVVAVDSGAVQRDNDGKLVHLSGQATTSETLSDPVFAVSSTAIALRRTVEMYQWQQSSHSETHKKLGGGEETSTTYSYDKAWADHRVDSSEFKKPEGHANPSRMPYQGETWRAGTVTLGAFTLSTGLASQMTQFEPVAPPATTMPRLTESAAPIVRSGNGYYLGANPNTPQVGDLRISFSAVFPAVVSVIAKQTGSSLSGYPTHAGRTLEMLEPGVQPAAAMFKAALQRNTLLTWVLRLAGLLGLFLGLYSIFKPLAVLADVLPFLGSLVAAGIGFVAFLIAIMIWFVVVAIAWLVYRPLLGLGLLGAAAVALVQLVGRARTRRAAATPPPLPTPR